MHGDILFDLQLTVVDAVQATFRIESAGENSDDPIGGASTADIHNGNDACYNVDVNGTRIVDHERCSAFSGWHDHDVAIAAKRLAGWREFHTLERVGLGGLAARAEIPSPCRAVLPCDRQPHGRRQTQEEPRLRFLTDGSKSRVLKIFSI